MTVKSLKENLKNKIEDIDVTKDNYTYQVLEDLSVIIESISNKEYVEERHLNNLVDRILSYNSI